MPEILGLAITPEGHVHTLETGGRIVRCMPGPAEVLHLGRERMDGLFASADGALHAVGGRYHTNAGGAWKSQAVPRKNRFGAMVSVWVPRPGDVWVGDSSGEVLRRDESGWTSVDTGYREGQTVHFIGGGGPEDVYVGGSGIHHFDGKAWRALEVPARNLFLDVIAFRGRAYFAGHDGLYERDGSTVRRVAVADRKVYALAVTDSELYLATGDAVLAWDGTSTRVALDVGTYRVASSGAVVAAGREDCVHVLGHGTFETAPKDAKPKDARPKDARPKDARPKDARPEAADAAADAPAPAAFERFQFFEQKVFEVALVGTRLFTRSGFIGKPATENVKTYATTAAAEKARDKLVAEKRSKGFRPV